MKFILIFLLTSTALRAQVPHIDYMIADEAKSQLQIHGSFGPDHTGGATIEGFPCSVRFWSDTMVICDLPDSGAGSGGHVIVQQMSGTSNARMLSIFKSMIHHRLFYYAGIHKDDWLEEGYCDWTLTWRADIYKRNFNLPQIFAFEISQTSTAKLFCHEIFSDRDANAILPWCDSATNLDSSISLKGYIDLVNFQIVLDTAKARLYRLRNGLESGIETSLNCYPKIISFDTINYILRGYHYSDTVNDFIKIDDRAEGLILFPPGIKNAVSHSSQSNCDPIKIFSHISSKDHQISFEAEEALGEMTASLYRIDGRLLKQEKISIPSAGMYSFDASGLRSGMGFLVLKTQKGIVAGKVVF